MPDPMELCTHCRVRVARFDGDYCSAACKAVADEAEAMHDARNLAQVALMKGETEEGLDPLVGLAWLAYQWRTTPSAYETLVRDLAIDIVRQDCTDAEWTVWLHMRSNPQVTTLADAMAAKHTHANAPERALRAA